MSHSASVSLPTQWVAGVFFVNTIVSCVAKDKWPYFSQLKTGVPYKVSLWVLSALPFQCKERALAFVFVIKSILRLIWELQITITHNYHIISHLKCLKMLDKFAPNWLIAKHIRNFTRLAINIARRYICCLYLTSVNSEPIIPNVTWTTECPAVNTTVHTGVINIIN